MLRTRLASLAFVLSSFVTVGAAQGCGSTTWNLIAGQFFDVGSVTVSNDQTNIYVTFALDGTSTDIRTNTTCSPAAGSFGTLHLWLGDDILNVPANPQGTPVPGQFPYHFDATGQTSHTFTVPLAEIGIQNVTNACGRTIYVVAHAEVNVDTDCDGNTEGQTAFGGPTSGPGPRWWFYGAYTICCDFGNPGVPFCTTAYAKGGYVWVTQRKSNPENLPSLNLTQNRWGWAIKLTSPGTTTYPIWAGAGLNYTSNGRLVGSLMVNWDGSTVSFCYIMNPGVTIEELHVYAGDGPPTTIAPGQYGYTQSFDPHVNSWCDSLPLVDSDNNGVWVVAHSIACFTR